MIVDKTRIDLFSGEAFINQKHAIDEAIILLKERSNV